MFMMFKKYADGRKACPVPVATIEETRDFDRFPGGRQVDDGGAFVWTYCAARYWHKAPTRADDLRDAAALGRPSAPVPSAALAIIGKLLQAPA